MHYQLGRQVLAELSFCDRAALDDARLLEELLAKAAAEAGSTLLSVHVHRFQPYGLSGVAILAESHLAIHTWPELGYAAVDAFTCGEHVEPRHAVQVMEAGLQAQCMTTMELSRGVHPAVAVEQHADLVRPAADGRPAYGGPAAADGRPGSPPPPG